MATLVLRRVSAARLTPLTQATIRPFSTALATRKTTVAAAQPATSSQTASQTATEDTPQATTDGSTLRHFAFQTTAHPLEQVKVVQELHLQRPSPKSYLISNPAYTPEEVNAVTITHAEPSRMSDKAALLAIRTVRYWFDKFTGYGFVNFDEQLWLRRMIFLETVAGVPGMVGGMLRHLRSLRLMRRDYGWIHTLLEEAENERMHLLTFLALKQPGLFFRFMVLAAQGVFFNIYFLGYLVSPATAHRFVGYLEEEAVKTYTHCLKDLDAGKLAQWAKTPAPEIAKSYWHLPDNAMMRDVIMVIRADEANHRDVNHTFSSLNQDAANPFN